MQDKAKLGEEVRLVCNQWTLSKGIQYRIARRHGVLTVYYNPFLMMATNSQRPMMAPVMKTMIPIRDMP